MAMPFSMVTEGILPSALDQAIQRELIDVAMYRFTGDWGYDVHIMVIVPLA